LEGILILLEDKRKKITTILIPFIFNAIIESLDLREIALSGRQYTWAVGWEEKYPLVTVRALTRAGSDHTPLLIDAGSPTNIGKNNHFSFELSWLRKEGFFEMVRDKWVSAGDSPVDTWQNKIRCLRQFLREWARNMSGEYKKEKK
jgi:hypothetical protein